MNLAKVTSFDDFIAQSGKSDKAFVLFYKPQNDASECALKHLKKIDADKQVFLVDVSRTRDVHPKMGVNAVPTLVVWQDNSVKNLIKGCQSESLYKQVITGETGKKYTSNGKPQKRVTVYSTPSCPYCNKLKQYLDKHGIRYTDINVASDQRAAEEMVRKSGQRGVPQTDINGQIIIGFDVPKISKLLNIPTE
jgi:glutaredoxin-like YruB-family protein